MKIAVLPGDGIGTEIVAEAVKVLSALDLKFEMETALVGGVRITETIDAKFSQSPLADSRI